MSRTLPFMGKTHPLTGEPIRAIGFRPNGDPLWPIMGGDGTNDPPERPEDVPEDEWTALGDPGKRAIVRVRQERDDALAAQRKAESDAAAARARPAPPAAAPPAPKAPAETSASESVDVEALVNRAVEAAVKPFQDRESEREASEAAAAIQSAVTEAAKDRLHDPSDALIQIDLTKITDGSGKADAEKVKAELDALLEKKPYLAKVGGPRAAPPGIGSTPGSGPAPSLEDQVKAKLADMQRMTNIRPAAN